MAPAPDTSGNGASSPPLDATAIAHPNIALVKYWGKRDEALNLPATGSISITLDTLRTRTRVEFGADLAADELHLAADDGASDNGAAAGYDEVPAAPGATGTAPNATGTAPGATGTATAAALRKVTRVLDLLRAEAGITTRARVTTGNSFPTGAGLASSASGFAALVTATDAALGTNLSRERLSELARRGSGSAARSVLGGFVEMHRGERPDGTDAVATPLLPEQDWPLAVVVAITTRDPKATGSSAGMELSRRTSPFFDAWVSGADADLAEARTAIRARDFAALAAISEHSCATMHALMLSTRPALLYWMPATVACLHLVRELRESDGLGTFFTVDAGPQVKAVCLAQDAPAVAAALAEVPGVLEVVTTGLGPGARVITGPGGGR